MGLFDGRYLICGQIYDPIPDRYRVWSEAEIGDGYNRGWSTTNGDMTWQSKHELFAGGSSTSRLGGKMKGSSYPDPAPKWSSSS